MQLSQAHLDMLNLMKGEAEAILGAGDNSPHNDNIRRFSNIFDIVAGLAGTIIHMQAEQKAAKVAARGETSIFAATVAEPEPLPVAVVEAPKAPVVVEEHAPLTLAPPAPVPPAAPLPPVAPVPAYSFGPTV